MRCFVLLALSQIAMLAFMHSAFLTPLYAAEYADDTPNEYIFQVIMPPDWRIADSIFAYEKQGKYYLPLSELSRGFEFYTDVDVGNLYAEGFAADENKKFSLDGKRHELVIGQERETLSDDAILVSDDLESDDLYVKLEVINKIWPVNLKVDLGNLVIQASTTEELPFMKRKERSARKAIAETRQEIKALEKELLPLTDNPYQMVGKPVIDLQSTNTYDAQQKELTGTHIISGKQQIGKMIADFSTSIPTEGREFQSVDSVRLNLSRRSAGEDYLVPGVRSIEGGDVSLRPRDLVGNTATGRGAIVSNDTKNSDNEFDKITVEGSGPPGWEIELYENDELTDFGTVDDDGRYLFENVVIEYGTNQIKLIFYGPQGQTREEIRTYTAGGNMRKPGEFVYKAGVLDNDKDLISFKDKPITKPPGVVRTLSTAYGVNRWLTLFGNYFETPLTDRKHTYLTTGASVGTPIGLMEAEAYKDTQQGRAYNLRYLTSFLGIRANLGASVYKNFESEDAGFGDARKDQEYTAQLTRNFSLFGIPIGLRLNADHVKHHNGTTNTDLDFTQTYAFSGLRLSNAVRNDFVDNKLVTGTGNLALSWREGNWQYRGGFAYATYPVRELSSMNGEMRYRFENGLQTALSGAYDFAGDTYNVGTQIGYDFKKFLASIENKYDKNDGWEFIVRLSTSLHPYTSDSSYAFSSTSHQSDAPVRARIFLDKDANGIWSDGDEPMEDVKILVGSGRSRDKTDENGYIIAKATENERVNLRVDPKTLADPYLMPGSKGLSIIPLRGVMPDIYLPVVETGAIEGTVYRASNGRAVAGLTMELHDENGDLIKSTETGYDGYYTFEFIPPGFYTIKPDSKQPVTLQGGEEVKLTPDKLFVYGNDLFVVVPGDDSDALVPPPPLPEGADENGMVMMDEGDVEEYMGKPLEVLPVDEEMLQEPEIPATPASSGQPEAVFPPAVSPAGVFGTTGEENGPVIAE